MGERHHVHHAYIWLEGLTTTLWASVATGFVIFSTIMSIVDDDPELAMRVRALGFIGVGAFIVLIVIIAGIAFGIRALAYKNLYYELTQTELGVYSGIISKKRVHVPYQKIQSVDIKATLLQRIFGLCTVVIDTAGGAANKAVMVPCLQKQTAEALRNELYSLKGAAVSQAHEAQSGSVHTGYPVGYAPPSGAPIDISKTDASPVDVPRASVPTEGNIFDVGERAWDEFGGVFSAQAVQDQAPSFEYGLSNKEIFLTGISNSGGMLAAIIGALIAGICTLLPMLFDAADAASLYVGFDSESAIESIMGSALAFILPIALGAVVAIALFIWGLATLSVCLQFGGFRARRRGSRIEVERGLLQHNAISLDIERVQSVVIKQSLIRRLMGYCEVSLGKVNAKESSSSKDSNASKLAEAGFVIHPFVKLDKVDSILHGMIPEYAELPKDEVRVAPVALRRGLIRRCILQGGGFWLAVVTALVQAFMHLIVSLEDPEVAAMDALENASILAFVDVAAWILYALAIIIFAFDVVGTVLWYRDSRFAKNRRMVLLTNGGMSKSTVALPKTKVQFGGTKANPLQRRAGTATVQARTAAGIGGTGSTLIDVTSDVADSWLEWLEPIS